MNRRDFFKKAIVAALAVATPTPVTFCTDIHDKRYGLPIDFDRIALSLEFEKYMAGLRRHLWLQGVSTDALLGGRQ